MKDVIYQRAALDKLRRIPKNVKDLIRSKIAQHARGEGAQDNNLKRMKDRNPPEYRLRIGNWRAFFLEDDAAITVLKIEIRGEAYKRKGKH